MLSKSGQYAATLALVVPSPGSSTYRFVTPPHFDEAIDPNCRTLVQTARGRLGRLSPLAFDALKGLEITPVLNLYRSPKLMEVLARHEAIMVANNGPSYMDITMSRSTERAGWVYALALPAYPGHVKIGHCMNLDCRRAQLSTSVPEDFIVLRAMHFAERAEAERAMRKVLHETRVRSDREWFAADREHLEAAFREVGVRLGGRG